ncbi:MAG TPA: hypothetical protein PL033_16365 [Candidatus Brocadiia bacterium]|nr:hypothetical protein [Candidatus Brocadiia bacterium]
MSMKRIAALILLMLAVGILSRVARAAEEPVTDVAQAADAAVKAEFAKLPWKVVYETWRGDNWELCMVGPDGSNPVNLTNTKNSNELYPHASPDGTKITFCADDKDEAGKLVRNVYYMNADGSGRTLVEKNAREAFWSPDGKTIGYLKGEFEEFCYNDYATKGIYFYDLATGKKTAHPNDKIEHLYNPCWSPDGKWIVSTVHGGMGFKHAILIIEVGGTGVYDMETHGCRPDFSPDGKKIAWGGSDWDLYVGDIEFKDGKPDLTNEHKVVSSLKPNKIYHIDWSPDGNYIVFSRGSSKKQLGFAPEIVGIKAEGWNIYAAKVAGKRECVQLTTDGCCNKEPDWVPTGTEGK